MSTVEEKKVRAMMEAATSPISLVPFVLGATGGVALLTFGVGSVLAIAGSVVAVGWGLGSAWYRSTSSEAINRKVTQAMKEEEDKKKAEELEALQSKLTSDESSLLNEILGLTKLVESSRGTDMTQADILINTKDLLDQSYAMLFKVPKLNELLKVVSSSKNAVKAIREQKSKILNDVRANIEYVGEVIAELQSIGSSRGNNQEEVRKQLSTRLDAAKVFDEQLSALSSSMSAEQIAMYAKAS